MIKSDTKKTRGGEAGGGYKEKERSRKRREEVRRDRSVRVGRYIVRGGCWCLLPRNKEVTKHLARRNELNILTWKMQKSGPGENLCLGKHAVQFTARG